MVAVGLARTGAPVSPTGSGESPSRKGRERGPISRFHAGWVSGRDDPLELMTGPTKRHALAGLANWTVHGEYPATVPGLRAPTSSSPANS